ncbi:universal stress protein [Piscinibacter terrae]|uniref:Universal stress protein n=1 Tax=Piscinibacter terrae TaxID=2496871 RepID=A0A3N7HKB8_9BURK|nr:universal stress protein [Albitalea terrae]RQP22527.1 universal stress protein [Albitalea terrae]
MNILLPVDGSDLSLEAVHHAIRLVREGLKADFVLANVQERSSLYEVLVVHDADALRRVALEAGEHAVAKADALLSDAGITHDTEIAVGDPAHTLVELAESNACDVIIMGAHGEGGSGAALGTVAQSVLRHSPVPVMIVRPPQAEEASAQGASEEQTVDSAP